jgi:hypothetical protein
MSTIQPCPGCAATNKYQKDCIAELESEVLAKHAAFRKLEAENAALKADAERYRWLRNESEYFGEDSKPSPWIAFGVDGTSQNPISGDKADAAIDARREG